MNQFKYILYSVAFISYHRFPFSLLESTLRNSSAIVYAEYFSFLKKEKKEISISRRSFQTLSSSMRKKGKKRKERKEKTIRKFRNENNPPRGTVSPALYPSLPDSLWLDASPCPSTPTLLSGYFARFNLARLSVSAKLRWRKEPPATRSSCILVVPENHVRPFPTCNEGLQLSVYLRKEDRLPFACHPRTNEKHTRFSSREEV